MTEQPEFHNYSFLVDGGLHVSARANSEKKAADRIHAAWPRSTIELTGIDLPASERKLPVPTMGTVTKTKPVHERKDEDEILAMSSKLGMTETEASLVSAFV
ncbi:MAG: hypothetical protein HRT93_03335 [Piscirickettsiaceae bacterium]|nr:hypothetical protein [Piscirickettsiaceae bacterium]